MNMLDCHGRDSLCRELTHLASKFGVVGEKAKNLLSEAADVIHQDPRNGGCPQVEIKEVDLLEFKAELREEFFYANDLGVAVHSIHLERDYNEIQIFIIINQKEYNDQLMDILLDKEYEFKNKRPDLAAQFHYLPVPIYI